MWWRQKCYEGLNFIGWKWRHLNSFMRRFVSYRNQSIDLQSKSKDWLLYDRNLRLETVKGDVNFSQWNWGLHNIFAFISLMHCKLILAKFVSSFHFSGNNFRRGISGQNIAIWPFSASLRALIHAKYILKLPVPIPDEKKKIKLNFYFHTSLWCLKKFYKGLKGLHKTFWGPTKKCENKNLT